MESRCWVNWSSPLPTSTIHIIKLSWSSRRSRTRGFGLSSRYKRRIDSFWRVCWPRGFWAPLQQVPLQKMGPEENPEVFSKLFELTVEVWRWSEDQWAVQWIPLLSGEAQLAARQLPVQSLLTYKVLKMANLQWLGCSPEQYHQHFRSLTLQECGHLFAFAQQLREAYRQWLLPEDHNAEGVVNVVVLEQFSMQLSRQTVEWVKCHRPASLEAAIQLVEDHLAAYGGSSSSSLSPSHSLFLFPLHW